MMEVDGKEFCGLGLEVRAPRPVGRGGVLTTGNEIICWESGENGHVAPLGISAEQKVRGAFSLSRYVARHMHA